ncbi:MAG TPA: DUF4003 family protein [Thermotogota bacterium]|nr:DUF4003 family protein [Thermotogota bacterium]
MKAIYESKIDSLISHHQALKSSFKWEHDLNLHLVALNYVLNNKTVNPDRLKEAQQFIKENTGLFSSFRGTNLFAICGLLVSENDMALSRLKTMMANVELAKKSGFKNSNYLPAALYALDKVYDGKDTEIFLKKAHDLYKEIKRNHPFLTGGDDYALAIILANNNGNSEAIEKNYRALAEAGFSKSNGLQMMSHILTLSDTETEKLTKICITVYEKLKENKLKINSTYYPAIALISLLPEEHTEDLIEVAQSLKSQKGYKWLGKGMNVLIASALIAGESVNQIQNEVLSTTLQVSIQSIISAQIVALIAAVSASTTVAASTAS